MSGLTSKACSTLYWQVAPTTTACVPTSGPLLIPSTSEPTAKTNAAIVPTANNSLAKQEETPRVEPAKYQIVLVYAYIHTKESDVTLDGQLNEAFWAQARAIRPVPRDPAAANDDTSELRFALTNDALYVGIRQPIEKTAAIWEVSVMTANRQGTQVALYGQPNGNISVYFCASPATGMIAVTGRKSTASVVSVKSTDHVTAEFRVPRTDLPTTAKAYDALLVNVGTFPESDSKTPCHVSSPWLIGTSPTYNPAFFGSLQLGRH